MGNVAYDVSLIVFYSMKRLQSLKLMRLWCQMDMPASLPFSQSFDFASGATGERFQNPFWKIKEFIFGAPFRKAILEVKRFGHEIVSAAVSKREKISKGSEKTKDKSPNGLQSNLIDSLLDHIEDHQIVADAAMNYLSAGSLFPFSY